MASRVSAPKKFRPEIEGLRAIAVVSVLVFHAGLIGNGFIGVDIFFVISGFLIGGQLFRELEETGRIDFWQFAVRRFRRLMPNALLVVAVSFVAGLFLLNPIKWEQLAGDATAAIANVVNFGFADRETDYFAEGSEKNPLLHYWSLSVEEQFYLLIALMILACLKLRRLPTPQTIVLAVTILSFLGSITVGQANPEGSFYLTHYRIWEMGIGVLLAIHWDKLLSIVKNKAQFLFPFGVAILLVTVCFPGSWTPWPSGLALLPTFATALVILCASPAHLGHRLLANTVMEWLGSRSYSLYLWHWPILVYGAIVFPEHEAVWLPCLVLAFVLAELAYRFVEQPARKAQAPLRRPKYYTGVALAMIPAVAATAFLSLFVMREAYADKVARAELLETARNTRSEVQSARCLGTFRLTPDTSNCVFGDKQSPVRVALIGDSHIMHLFDGIEPAAEALNMRVEAYMMAACPPFLAERFYHLVAGPYDACLSFRQKNLQYLRENPPSVLIISSAQYFTQLYNANGEQAGEEGRALFKNHLIELATEFVALGTEVIVSIDTPTADLSFHACVLGGGERCTFPMPEGYFQNPDRLAIPALEQEVTVVQPHELYCTRTECTAFEDGLVRYKDASHLSVEFSRQLQPFWTHILGQVIKSAEPGP